MRAAIRNQPLGLLSVVILLWAAFALMAAPVSAQNRPLIRTGPLYGTTYPTKISYKLFQGCGNVLFCWAEIPYEMNHEIQNTDLVTGGFTGFFRGLFFTGRRLVLGVVDIVTFPIDVYGNNYQSIQRTEFPFIDEVE